MARAVRWDLIADPKGFQRGFREANRTADTFARGMRRTAGLVGGAFAAIGVAKLVKDTIGAASDLNETINKTNVIFGKSSKEIRDWSQGSAKSMGLSRREALASAASFGDMFLQLKLGRKPAVDMSTSMVELAADFASFHNADITEVLEAQSAAFRGEYDSLQRFIPGITAARVEQVALNQTHKDSAKDLTAAEKATATYSIMLKDAAKAQGDFKRTSDGAANQQRIFAAAVEDLEASFGQLLLPAFTEVVNFANDTLVPALGKVADWLGKKLPQALEDLDTWWDDNKESIETLTAILVDTFVPGVGESDTAVKDFATSLGTLKNFLTDVSVAVLEGVKVWLALEHVTIGVISVFGSAMSAAGHLINAIDRLSGGTGHAGDKFVELGKKAKEQATKELKEVRKAAVDAQAAIDRLHGKDVKITGTTSLQFTKSFTAVDWSHARQAAGRMAQGGKITKGTGPTADDVLIRASKGETVVPADASRDPGFQQWAAGQRIPGFALGGKIAQTGTAHTGVGKMMDRWGTLRVAAGIKAAMGGGPGIQRALSWARGEAGKPYIWGGVGPGGYDCSGFMSALANVVAGRAPHRRLFATGTFPAAGWEPGYSPVGFSIGSRRGSPGHMAGNLAGTPVESRGSRGVVVGSGARGARDPLFGGHVWHLVGRSGGVGGQERLVGFDKGGWLPPGLSMAYNGTGRPERVLPPDKSRGGDIHVHLHGDVYGDTNALVARIRTGIRESQRRGGIPPGQQLR